MHLQPRNSTTKGFNMFQHYPSSKDSQYPSSFPYPHPHFFSQHNFPFLFPSLHPTESLFYKRSLLNQSPFQPPLVKIEEPEASYPSGLKTQETQNQNSSTQMKALVKPKANEVCQDQVARAYQKKIHQMCRRRPRTEQEMEEIKKYRNKRVEDYIAKKGKRKFEKKIVYDTRKKVADRRIRFKGKFINEYQARELLGLEGQDYTFAELKSLMYELRKHQ